MKSEQKVEQCINRHKAFFASKKPGLLTLLNYRYGSAVPEKLPIDSIDWTDETSIERFAESQYQMFAALNRKYEKEDDDYLPWMGIQVGTGSIGASYLKDCGRVQMHYESITDWMDPPVMNWDDMDNIGFNPENPYFKALFQVTRYLVDRCNGNYGIRNYPHFNALDLANQFRGNELFTDIYDEPDNMLEMLKRNNQTIIEMEEYIQKNLIKPAGVFGSVCGIYINNGVYLSCDAGDMVGPDSLRDFGWAEMQALCRRFTGAFLHHHEMGISTLPVWGKMNELTIQHLMRDPNTAHLDECINQQIIESSLNVPVLFYTSYAEYMKLAPYWAQGRFAVRVDVFDDEQARNVLRTANKFRDYL